MSEYDDVPAWCRYAEWVGNGHDKYYEITISLTDKGWFVLSKRWGARPDRGRGQIKTETHSSLSHVTAIANAYMNAKIAKGYCEITRPLAARLR